MENLSLNTMKINLYSTYFISSSQERQQELDFCLIKNLENMYIYNVNIFIENNAVDRVRQITNKLGLFEKNKLNLIVLDKIPSYKDWLENSKDKDEISVFSNADIYFDQTINRVFGYLRDKNSLICLSRHEIIDNKAMPHKKPKWSQDAWIINSNQINDIDFLEKLEISTGACRCDNKLAYRFAISGWNLYNPFEEIKCYHKHESGIRNYKRKDRSIIGGLAFVNPSIYRPSEIEIEIMPMKKDNIKSCNLNNYLCKS